MKKIAVLATSLVLGLSSVAFAKPAPLPAPAPAPAPYHDHDQGWHRPMPMPEWTLLASSASLNRRGRALIDVNSNARFTKLKLEATSALMIDKVVVTFTNGKTQVIELDKRLGRFQPGLVLDLEGSRGRKIDKIMVVGKGTRYGYRGSSFKLMAV